jgi:heme a synthase
MATMAEVPAGKAAAHGAGPQRLAWLALGWNMAVVLWGAYVRESQSGAGCGSHWPLCNGVVVPQMGRWHTVVEFVHRMSSGVGLLLVAALLVVAFRVARKGSLARWAAGFAAFFMFNEALLGALLVLLRKVEMDQSVGRAVYLCLHSTNTLLLLGALTLAAYWLGAEGDGRREQYREVSLWPGVLAMAGTLAAAATGAIAALGDTLFPASSLHQAWAQDFAANSHYALRLRWMHPACATLLLGFVLWMVWRDGWRQMGAWTLATLVGVQYALGIADMLLLAPLWMQIVHLLFADIFWVTLLLVVARSGAEKLTPAFAKTTA